MRDSQLTKRLRKNWKLIILPAAILIVLVMAIFGGLPFGFNGTGGGLYEPAIIMYFSTDGSNWEEITSGGIFYIHPGDTYYIKVKGFITGASTIFLSGTRSLIVEEVVTWVNVFQSSGNTMDLISQISISSVGTNYRITGTFTYSSGSYGGKSWGSGSESTYGYVRVSIDGTRYFEETDYGFDTAIEEKASLPMIPVILGFCLAVLTTKRLCERGNDKGRKK